MSTTLNDSFWLERITQCRSSGLTDRQWCIENGIPVSTFYYHVRALRKKACEIPENGGHFQTEAGSCPDTVLGEGQLVPDGISAPSPSICLQMQGIRVEIHEHAGADVIRNTLLALHQLC